MPQPKPAYILKRGAYDQHGEPVSANTLAVLPPLPPDAPHNRLGLARWLVAPNNPLLARVTVNRAWEMMFGRGIVETVDNFGSRGAVPSHPELLDWLAADFMHSGWDYKALLKKNRDVRNLSPILESVRRIGGSRSGEHSSGPRASPSPDC